MEVARPLGIIVSFVSLLMLIIYMGAFSISSTEISRSSNVSDTLHQAIESMTLDVLISNLDAEAKKDFVILLKSEDIPLIQEQIRDGIRKYRKAFPDIVLNETGTQKSAAQCLTRSGVNSPELISAQIGALNIVVFCGTATFNPATGKYTQTEDQLPWIQIYNSNSGSHPAGMDKNMVGYYLPPAKQAVGPSILPISFHIKVETRFLVVGSSAGIDNRDKITNSSNSTAGEKTSSLDNTINFDAADGGSGISTGTQVDPNNPDIGKTLNKDGQNSNFSVGGTASW